MIEAGRMEDVAARLFAPLINDMGATKEKYIGIQESLVDAILFEMAKKTVFEVTDAAKFAINILKRNLFERTADVGYLATDAEIVNLLRMALDSADSQELDGQRERIRARLAEYQYEYTVYDEIVIVDRNGVVQANLDPNNRIARSNDPCLSEAQAIDLHSRHDEDKYIEFFRPTDLKPGRGDTLVYAQKIEDPDTHAALGTLCLCFSFDDEMAGIFKDLSQGNEQMVVAILNENGAVLSSSETGILPKGSRVDVDIKADFRIMPFQGKSYIVSTVATDGYQGFYGLTWYGLAMMDVSAAFRQEHSEFGLEQAFLQNLHSFSGELSIIKDESDDLLADMKLDSINGQVKAARHMADGFVEVLRFVDWIGDEIDDLFSEAIRNLQKTVVTSLFGELEFRAFQGNNIADRNLYERANDVCWWALTPLFRQLLTRHADQSLNDGERHSLTANLQYINNLYTPYLRLVLADTNGTVVAVSNPPEELEERLVKDGLPTGQELVGTQLERGLVKRALELKSSKEYAVSCFEPTPLYGGRPTYVYTTAVRHPEVADRVVGVIQIVFDAEPQFMSMLSDILPRDEKKRILDGSFGVFADRHKMVIASTSDAFQPGTTLRLPDALFSGANSERSSSVVQMDGSSYAVGRQISSGYREYKCSDGYDNDIVCLIFVPL
ncbi:hypothetical protein DQK91_07935 [Oceanidesulfovibrio marinus]|uniref:Chemotaxis protein CheW n=2 Tax=Oceanidesulfovibrio marinus TaxID=370038 RepID=A0A6P1ZKQ4_9BACT|nr:hypothetical protein DQK91_07935 [Oceanidesulfovibrio marinus]